MSFRVQRLRHHQVALAPWPGRHRAGWRLCCSTSHLQVFDDPRAALLHTIPRVLLLLSFSGRWSLSFPPRCTIIFMFRDFLNTNFITINSILHTCSPRPLHEF
jgi:hypothetical protein